MEHSELMEEFLTAKLNGIQFAGPPASERTIKTYRNQLKRLERYTGKKLEDIERADVEKAMIRAQEEGLSPSYRNLLLSAGRGFYDWALGEGKPIKAQHNPFAGIRMSKRVKSKTPKHITKAQFNAIIRAMEQIDREQEENARAAGPQTANVPWVNDPARLAKKMLPVKLMFYGGLRINEAVSLKIENILEEENAIYVEGKGDKSRIVPLPKWLIRELAEYVAEHSDDDTYVFTPLRTSRYKEGTHLAPSRIHAPFHEAVKRAGLPDWVTPHTLRHSYAKMALERTGRLDWVQDLLGHEHIETTRIYARTDEADIKKAAAMIWD